MSTRRKVNAKQGHQGFHETEKDTPASGLSGLTAEVGDIPEAALLSPVGQFVEFDGQRSQMTQEPWGSMLGSTIGDQRAFTYTTYTADEPDGHSFYVHTELHNKRGIVSVNVAKAERIESLSAEARAAHDAMVSKAVQDMPAPEPEPVPEPEGYVSAYGAPDPALAGNNGTPEAPVDYRDKRVQLGYQFDTIVGEGGTTFHRRRNGVLPGSPYAMRFQNSGELSDEEILHACQIIGYKYATTVRGEQMPHPVRDSPCSFVIHADTTKSTSDDLGMAMEKFEDDFKFMLQYGSPQRTTDRAGAGTKGTRLVKGMGNYAPNLDIYYDDVHFEE